MTPRESSRTAAGVAWLRAAHQIVDGEPRILDDPIAPLLLGDRGRLAIDTRRDELFTPCVVALRAQVLLRSRYTEDRLAVAAGRGIGQYVVLGAGLDTFAYRQPSWARPLRIFEADQPASQLTKRERLAAAAIRPPENLRFAPIDFESEALPDALARSGVAPDEPAFFSWLGVAMYLTEEAVRAVLAAVAAFPAKTELVFTFARPRAAGPSIADRAAAVGEPWRSFFEPTELEEMLLDCGFGSVDFLSVEAAAHYFAGRTDALSAPRRVSIARAVV